MSIEFPNTKATKDAIRGAIGQSVTFVIQGDPTPCPVCSGLDDYDPVNESSMNSFCDVCSGLYWITADTTIDIVSHVKWKTQDQPNMGVAGVTYDCDCTITVDIDDISTSDIDKVQYVIADARKLQVYRTIYKGVPTRDRIRFVLKEWDKE